MTRTSWWSSSISLTANMVCACSWPHHDPLKPSPATMRATLGRESDNRRNPSFSNWRKTLSNCLLILADICADITLEWCELDKPHFWEILMRSKDLTELARNSDFISGIYNYCDRWCERCPFTARCLVFATEKADEDDDPESRDIRNAKFWQKLASTFEQT